MGLARGAFVILGLLGLGLAPGPVAAQGGPVTAYPAGFFAAAQPSSALDMLQRLPGFTFDPGDADVRGFGGAAGNVLIDGQRPTTKQEALEDVVRRIPAGAVDRIELLRSGAPGVDLAGHAVVANVVRRAEPRLAGKVELGLDAGDGRLAPRVAVQANRRVADRAIEASATLARALDDEKGAGAHGFVDAAGAPLRLGRYQEAKWRDQGAATLGYERRALGGTLRLQASLKAERESAEIVDGFSQPAVTPAERVAERSETFEGEAGLHFDRPLTEAWNLEGLVLLRGSRMRAQDRSEEGDGREVATQALDATETIVRGLARRENGSFTMTAGVEAALNTLRSHNGLELDGVTVPLPSASVRVEEGRVEAFTTVVWRATPTLTADFKLGGETSRLALSGDAHMAKALTYGKPRLALSWQASPADILRLELERRIGQLNFEDFVGSASLTSNTVTAGNPDLEPDKVWRTSLTWERTRGGRAVVLAYRHDEIDDVVDRVPVVGPGFAFDAPGNIGHGRRDEAQVSATLPLAGRHGLQLKGDVTWRRSRVRDPATGEARPISGEPALEGALHLTQDLPLHRFRWGLDLALGERSRTYLFNEVKSNRVDARLAAFVEYRRGPAWTLRLHAENLTNGSVDRRREQYLGLRGQAALRRVETRSMSFGPYVGVSLERALGR